MEIEHEFASQRFFKEVEYLRLRSQPAQQGRSEVEDVAVVDAGPQEIGSLLRESLDEEVRSLLFRIEIVAERQSQRGGRADFGAQVGDPVAVLVVPEHFRHTFRPAESGVDDRVHVDAAEVGVFPGAGQRDRPVVEDFAVAEDVHLPRPEFFRERPVSGNPHITVQGVGAESQSRVDVSENHGGNLVVDPQTGQIRLAGKTFFPREPAAGAQRVFHCEFSVNRGPYMAQIFRGFDRELNKEKYPELFYPNIYILDGGYKKFFAEYSDFCDGGYVPMRDEEHKLNGDLVKSTSQYRESCENLNKQHRQSLVDITNQSSKVCFASPASGELNQSPMTTKMLHFLASPTFSK